MRSNAFAIIVGNLASKAVGAFREILFAYWFGTGAVAASFRIAQTAYLLPTHAFIGDTLSAGLLPLYRQLKAENADAARLLVVIASAYGLLFSSVVTVLLYFLADSVSHFLAPGGSSSVLSLASTLLKILSLTTPFYVLSGMLGFIEAAYGHYGVIAWRPMLLNMGSICGATLAVLLKADHWLATGLVLSHIALFTWTAIEFRKLDRLLPETHQTWVTVIRVSGRFLKNIAPLIGLPVIGQLNILVERNISSWMGTDVIPSVDYARFIGDTAVQLIAVPLGIVTLSTHGGSKAHESHQHILKLTTTVMLLSFPAAVFIFQNAESIVRLLFARGAFTEESVKTTTDILCWMGGGLGATVTAYYLVKALNAQLRNAEALACSAIGCIASVLVNFLLWRELGPRTIGVAVAASSVTLLALCISRLGFWRDLLPVAAWLAAGTCLQLVCSWLLFSGLEHPFQLLANAVLSCIVWIGIVTYSRPLREAASPFLGRILRSPKASNIEAPRPVN